MFRKRSARYGNGSWASRAVMAAGRPRYPWIYKMRCPAAGSYPAVHVPILAGWRGKGVKWTASMRVWQSEELQTDGTSPSKPRPNSRAPTGARLVQVTHCSERWLPQPYREVCFGARRPRRRVTTRGDDARCLPPPPPLVLAPQQKDDPLTATDTYTERKNKAQRKYSGAGLF